MIKLQPKHELFVNTYLSNNLNMGKAYESVYGKLDYARASKLFKREDVQARINELLKKLIEKRQDKITLIFEEFSNLIFNEVKQANEMKAKDPAYEVPLVLISKGIDFLHKIISIKEDNSSKQIVYNVLGGDIFVPSSGLEKEINEQPEDD